MDTVKKRRAYVVVANSSERNFKLTHLRPCSFFRDTTQFSILKNNPNRRKYFLFSGLLSSTRSCLRLETMNFLSTCGISDAGRLSHLVEAATALAKLNNNGAVAPNNFAKNRAVPRAAQLTSESKAPQQLQCEARSTTASELLESSNKKEIFPQRLMAILQDESLSDVITWLPHGRSFVIVRPDVFTEKVMPKYLPPVDSRASTKYPSFTRKLNRWGFRQATRGPDTGAFHHPLFRRDMPHLCLDMVCQRSKDRVKGGKKHLSTTKQGENEKRVAPLTKESLEAIAARTTVDEVPKKPATVSVTDDYRSLESISNADACSEARSDSSSSMKILPQGPVSTDAKLVAAIIKQRDDQERLKVAKAMLYEAYKKAVQGEL